MCQHSLSKINQIVICDIVLVSIINEGQIGEVGTNVRNAWRITGAQRLAVILGRAFHTHHSFQFG